MTLGDDQIHPVINDRLFITLSTDGLGRSDTRELLRTFFEVDRHFNMVAARKALVDEGEIPRPRVRKAPQRYGFDIDKFDPAGILTADPPRSSLT